MTENSVTQQEHEEFMRRAIELGAKGGLLERTGGKISLFYSRFSISRSTAQ